jgi:ATP-dependent RNA helicase DeaD
MTQDQRDRVMKRTRSGAVDILVATDVAARGLDIEQITHVVNFNVPESPAAYVHRIGRTGRAGREGVAITFAEPREHRMLKNIEQLTRQKVEVARLPTVLDVRNKQLEVTRASIRETILAGDLDSFRVIVESLSDEYDIMEVATAAVKLAHLAEVGAVEEAEIEQPALQRERPGVSARSSSSGPRSREGAAPRKRSPGMSRIYIGSGRKDNMRPADLVGAIANEANLDAKQIGSIEISDRFSLVELPEELVDSVIAALRATKIKGKRQTVRRDLATKRG